MPIVFPGTELWLTGLQFPGSSFLLLLKAEISYSLSVDVRHLFQSTDYFTNHEFFQHPQVSPVWPHEWE